MRLPSAEVRGSAFRIRRHWSIRICCMTANIGHRSSAETTWMVIRMSELRTTVRRRSAVARLAERESPARAASATGGHSGCWAWRDPSRRTTSAGLVRRIGSSSPWRARVARLSARVLSAAGGAIGSASGEPANDADDLALDLDLAGVNRLHLGVRRLETDAILLAEEALQGH